MSLYMIDYFSYNLVFMTKDLVLEMHITCDEMPPDFPYLIHDTFRKMLLGPSLLNLQSFFARLMRM